MTKPTFWYTKMTFRKTFYFWTCSAKLTCSLQVQLLSRIYLKFVKTSKRRGPINWQKLQCQVLLYLEPGVPRITARLHMHLNVATCQIPGTRDPRGLDPVHVSRRGAAGQRTPGRAPEVKPSLGAGPASEYRVRWGDHSCPPLLPPVHHVDCDDVPPVLQLGAGPAAQAVIPVRAAHCGEEPLGCNKEWQ